MTRQPQPEPTKEEINLFEIKFLGPPSNPRSPIRV